MTKIMGILNLTPDSYYSPSRTTVADFRERIEVMFRQGADIVDIGACSTRPGSQLPSSEEEWSRLRGALEVIRDMELSSDGSAMPRISIDTCRSEIVRKAFDIIGPFIVNDVTAGDYDPQMIRTAQALDLHYVAMFSRPLDRSASAAKAPDQVVDFFRNYLLGPKFIIDPGFGAWAGRTVEENLQILDALTEFKQFGLPILVGLSRKSFIYQPLGKSPETVLEETLALEARAVKLGADILRVHDVAPTAKMLSQFSL